MAIIRKFKTFKDSSLSYNDNMGRDFPNYKLNKQKRLKNTLLFKMIYNYRSNNFKLTTTNKMFRLKDYPPKLNNWRTN